MNEEEDLKIFDLLRSIYSVTIIFPTERRNDKSAKEYRAINGQVLPSFTEEDIIILHDFVNTTLPEVLRAHVSDVLWLTNHNPKDAGKAVSQYYKLYIDTFDADL